MPLPNIPVFDDQRPMSHRHDTSHLDVDPIFIPHRVEANAFINGAKLLSSSLIQTHTSHDPSSGQRPDPNVIDTSRALLLPTPRLNGFVEGVMEADGYRRRLVISPDVVWAAFLAQFSYFMRSDEAVRRSVWKDPTLLHKRLKIDVPEGMTRRTMPFKEVATQMKAALLDNLKDRDLVQWLDPSFATTADTNRLTFMTLLAGHCRLYDPGMMPAIGNAYSNGGIVAVTMLGTHDDWRKLHKLIGPLRKYSESWHSMLEVVTDAFQVSYLEPRNRYITYFWRRAIQGDAARMARTQLSGWITAFCVWAWTGEATKEFRDPILNIRGGHFKRIDNDLVPPAYAFVDVELRQRKENGEIDRVESLAEMVAGVFGSRYRAEKEMPRIKTWGGPTLPNDTTGVHPFSAWFLYQVTPEHVAALPSEDMPDTN